MVIQKRSEAVTLYKDKNVHSRTDLNNKSGQTAPVMTPQDGTILLEVLKTLETQIRSRNLLHSVHSFPFHPLWFQAENERNVFLWREGFSIIQKDEFEFWIDVPALIKKREKALINSTYNHPLSNPNWPSMSDATQAIEIETKYLNEIAKLFDGLAMQATALCEASSRVVKELCAHEPQRHVVILPVSRAK
jgi:hypothetical protein